MKYAELNLADFNSRPKEISTIKSETKNSKKNDNKQRAAPAASVTKNSKKKMNSKNIHQSIKTENKFSKMKQIKKNIAKSSVSDLKSDNNKIRQPTVIQMPTTENNIRTKQAKQSDKTLSNKTENNNRNEKDKPIMIAMPIATDINNRKKNNSTQKAVSLNKTNFKSDKNKSNNQFKIIMPNSDIKSDSNNVKQLSKIIPKSDIKSVKNKNANNLVRQSNNTDLKNSNKQDKEDKKSTTLTETKLAVKALNILMPNANSQSDLKSNKNKDKTTAIKMPTVKTDLKSEQKNSSNQIRLPHATDTKSDKQNQNNDKQHIQSELKSVKEKTNELNKIAIPTTGVKISKQKDKRKVIDDYKSTEINNRTQKKNDKLNNPVSDELISDTITNNVFDDYHQSDLISGNEYQTPETEAEERADRMLMQQMQIKKHQQAIKQQNGLTEAKPATLTMQQLFKKLHDLNQQKKVRRKFYDYNGNFAGYITELASQQNDGYSGYNEESEKDYLSEKMPF